MASSPQLFPRRIPRGLVAAYTFDHADARDVSWRGNDGTLNGGMAAPTGGVATLDGVNDYVSCGSSIDDNLSNGFTVTSWINPTSTGLQCVASNYYGDGTPTSTANGLFCRGSADRVDVVLAMNVITNRIQIYKSGLSLSGWTFVTYRWDGTLSSTGLSLLINTVEQTTIDASSGTFTELPQSVAPFKLGATRNFGAYAEFFDGQIGETRIYDRALSAQEISDIYNNTRSLYA